MLFFLEAYENCHQSCHSIAVRKFGPSKIDKENCYYQHSKTNGAKNELNISVMSFLLVYTIVCSFELELHLYSSTREYSLFNLMLSERKKKPPKRKKKKKRKRRETWKFTYEGYLFGYCYFYLHIYLYPAAFAFIIVCIRK